MPGEHELSDLLQRALSGDQQAGAELVRRLQPVIRRAVRIHLPASDPLRRLFDSLDISQSVLLGFFAKAGAGALHFRSPQQLRKLLRQMAAQKFIDKKRQAEAGRRDCRRDTGGWAVLAVPGDGASPEEVAARRELYEEVRRCFTRRERQIADLWAKGHTFSEISAWVPGSDGQPMKPNAVRMALRRAFLRIAAEAPRDGKAERVRTAGVSADPQRFDQDGGGAGHVPTRR